MNYATRDDITDREGRMSRAILCAGFTQPVPITQDSQRVSPLWPNIRECDRICRVRERGWVVQNGQATRLWGWRPIRKYENVHKNKSASGEIASAQWRLFDVNAIWCTLEEREKGKGN